MPLYKGSARTRLRESVQITVKIIKISLQKPVSNASQHFVKMCGIFVLLNYEKTYTKDFIQTQFEKGKARGPDHSTLQKVGCKMTFGFHRLAINGLNAESNQPITKGDLSIICNGEIYNYKELYALMQDSDCSVNPNTQSDCEVILWLYEKYGIEQTLQMLDGVFAFALLDQRVQRGEPLLFVARDPYGVRPLYSMHKKYNISKNAESTVGFASELKVLSKFTTRSTKDIVAGIPEFTQNTEYRVEQFPPGTYSKYVFSDQVCAEWAPLSKNAVYHRVAFANVYETPNDANIKYVLDGIKKYLTRAVEKRCSATDRPIACLLSGGLDSSLVAALVNEYHKTRGLPTIETYSIGLAESTDLKYARLVAEHLGTNHTEVILTEKEFCEAIPEVIEAIESYDTTTVRASIGNYLLGKYIAANSEAKVIFNGDGSDELLGGYLYMKSAPDAIEFDRECRRLLTDIHAFDVLRSDKSISSHGLEPRTPFLDRDWTQFYLSISPTIRRGETGDIEKYLLRSAFARTGLLPEDVLWRRKEAFSDGVSGQERSLYQILQEYCSDSRSRFGDVVESANMSEFTNAYCETCVDMKNTYLVADNLPKTSEQVYYRQVFERYYPGQGSIVPYFWMPKYVEATDASARTLAAYDNA